MSAPPRSRTAGAREDRLAQARARRQARQGAAEAVAAIPARPAGVTPLSSAQRRFWFVRQLDPAHDPFHLPVVLRLEGAVDTDRLVAAFRQVVARHEVLRTRIVEVDGEPGAVVDAAPADACRVRDVTDVDAAVRAAADAPFDLATDQPWRLDLLRGGTAVTLVATFHHVAFDGWSAGVLLTELGAAYRGETLPPLPLQYADLAHHRATPEGREGAQVEHWVRHLTGAPAALGFPSDRPRTPATRPAEASVEHELDPAALHQVMAAAGCTAFMVLLAAWHVVLARWTGTDDTVVGTAVAGRTRPETAPLIGCCVGTLALRTTAAPGDTVRDLLARTRGTVLDGLAHQGVGYEEVVEALHRSGSGLFDVSLTVHTEPDPELVLPGVTVTPVDLPGRWAQNEIELSVAGPGLTGTGPVTVTAQYFTELYDAATIDRVLGHLDQVLRGFAADLDRPVAAVPL
ncbi:MAG TPA: condensation domain-containing protein, partial [Mycobacteriales bacterium]|nr:condensation domain-containing protein [Mycobacteriales bacterium]